MSNKETLRTWIEIDKSAIKQNCQTFRSLIGKDCLLASVAKSNAYGHGLIDFSREVSTHVDWLIVDSVIEAFSLRQNKIEKPILVLGYTPPSAFYKAEKLNISLTLSSFESLKSIPENSKIKFHLKIDTGMHRQGFFIEDLEKVFDYIKENLPIIQIEGVYTHFAAAKNPAFPVQTIAQADLFEKAVSICHKRGFEPIRHTSATSGTLIYPQYNYDMVRIGIGLYGYWPSLEVEACCKDRMSLKPVLTWKSIISEIKALPKGSMIGYDFTEALRQDTKIGIIPIGYWHGFSRNLSSIGRVIIGGKEAKVLGRVCMDITMIDLSQQENSCVGDEVIILSHNSLESVKLKNLAVLSNKSEYEFITTINPLIKKYYI